MFDNSRFRDIKWEEIQEKHGSAWEELESKFRLKTEYESQAINDGSADTLCKIAMRCIYLCWDLLFTSSFMSSDPPAGLRIPYLNGWYINAPYAKSLWEEVTLGINLPSYPGFQNDPDTSRDLIESKEVARRLIKPLIEHLIVEFSYWFYNFNYGLHSQTKASEYVFTDLADPKKGGEGKWKIFKEHMTMSYKLYNEVVDSKTINNQFSIKDFLHSQNWQFWTVIASNWKASPFNADTKDVFDFALNEKYVESTRETLLTRLTKFFSNNQYLPLILTKYTEPEETLPASVIEFCKRNNRPIPPDSYSTITNTQTIWEKEMRTYPQMYFKDNNLMIPWEKRNTFKYERSIDARINSEESDIIPPVVQSILNCYLIEKVFHLRAIRIMIDSGMNDILNKEIENTYQNRALFMYDTVIPFHMNAPLIIEPLIKLGLEKNKDSNHSFAWLKPYVSQWNSVSLPNLEELFLWAIFESIQSEDIPSKIEEACIYRCIYHLISPSSMNSIARVSTPSVD